MSARGRAQCARSVPRLSGLAQPQLARLHDPLELVHERFDPLELTFRELAPDLLVSVLRVLPIRLESLQLRLQCSDDVVGLVRNRRPDPLCFSTTTSRFGLRFLLLDSFSHDALLSSFVACAPQVACPPSCRESRSSSRGST